MKDSIFLRLCFITILLSGVIIAPCSAQVKPVNTPQLFHFGKIPFSKSEEEVLRLVQDLKVQEDALPMFGNYEGLKDYFSGGLYVPRGDATNTYLNPALVKKISVYYDNHASLQKVELFFLKSLDSKDPNILFMVRKIMNEQGGPLESVFNSLADSITEKLRFKPAVDRTTYHIQLTKGYFSTEFADMGVWSLLKSKVILIVPSVLGKVSHPELIYVPKNYLKQYLSSCKKLDKESIKKETPKKKDTLGFF